MKMLVVNNYIDPELAREFEAEINRVVDLARPDVEADFFSHHNLPRPDLRPAYSHLLLSGSEASAMDNNTWDDDLARLLKAFVDSGRPVLGICYGHQFIIAALKGRDHVRRRALKIWGWPGVRLTGGGLFSGMEATAAVLCNSDEVFDLPDEFKVTATSDHCRVLAYAHRTKPVWGVQFHPEYQDLYGGRVLDKVLGAEDADSYSYVDQRREDGGHDANTRILLNFLACRPGG